MATEVAAPAVPSELPDPKVTPIALEILKRRYLIKNEKQEPVETPRELYWRVASTMAAIENRYGATSQEEHAWARWFYELMAAGKFIPNSPTLSNAGRPLGQLSACFVLPIEDSMEGIYKTLTHMALIHQSGGGTGFSFSRIRPRGDIVKSTMGVASGPVSFMKVYDASTEAVKQGGTRRGANMGILHVSHPDIEEFIDCKTDVTKITNFNISVAVTDAYMEAVLDDEDWTLINPRNGKVIKKISARYLWEKIIHNAWSTGEPGLFFIDEANQHNPVPHLGRIEATNPCGEQALLPYDVCNLGSINLGQFVKPVTGRSAIDWGGLQETVFTAVRFLDNVIDANQYPLPEIEDISLRLRRIGLGVMGWADMLIRLGIPYGSPESFELASEVQANIREWALQASEALAKVRGVFPEHHGSIWKEGGLNRRLRNCNLTTVAPTGTISILAGCSSGIEPLFAVGFRRQQAGADMLDINEDFRRCFKSATTHDLTHEQEQEICETGSIHHPWVPDDLKLLFVTTSDLDPFQHVRMQEVFQKDCCNAVSKTINLPKYASSEDVEKAYLSAWKTRCRGITVYRDGSRPTQPLSTGKTSSNEAEEKPEAENDQFSAEMKPRPEVLTGKTVRMESPLGRMYVTITEEDGEPQEVFIAVSKAGASVAADMEAVGRLASLALRSGIPATDLYKQLRGISTDKAVGFGLNKVLSGPDAIAQALAKVYPKVLNGYAPDEEEHQLPCPECGTTMLFEGNCWHCSVCGFSNCL